MGIATSDPYEYVEEAGSTRLRVGGTRSFAGRTVGAARRIIAPMK